MCDGECTDHGQCIYIPAGHTFATWPSSEQQTTQAVLDALADRGINRGTD